MKIKDSKVPWVGNIPSSWSIVQLSSIFKEHNNKNKLLEENNLLSLSYGKIIRKDINTKEGLLPRSFDGYNIIQKGDIVFRLTDLQNDKRSLRTGLCNERGIITSAYITIRKTQELHSEFFHYLLHSYDECKVFYGLGDGVRQGMTFDDLRKLLLVVPPFQLQQQIANFLDEKCADIDQLITLQQQMIDQLKAYKQSVITEAVTKGLDKSVPMKDSGIEWIGEVPEGWEIKRLKNIGYLYGGITGKSGEDFNVNEGDEFSYFIPFTNIYRNIEIDCTNLQKVKTSNKDKQNLVKKGDLLFLMSSEDYDGIGKVAIMNYDFKNYLLLNSFCKGFRINDLQQNPEYLNYFLLSYHIREMIRIEAKGFIRINLRMDKVANLPILIPCIEEQNSIVNFINSKLKAIDTLISIKQQKIDELKEYKKSMIYEYITGKKQVPNKLSQGKIINEIINIYEEDGLYDTQGR